MIIFKDIKGYEGLYQVSNHGEVKSLISKKILNPRKSPNGYYRVALYSGKKPTNHSIHVLVANSFIENPNNKSQVNHRNGDKKDNRAENLEWVTPSENIKHAYKNNLISNYKGQDNHRAKLTNEIVEECKKLHSNGLSTYKIAKIYNVSQSVIWKAVTNRSYVS